jgi:peptidoglycan/xylan/chitin deacetylase (PgdA/CDA1 family)/CelD/BcsL family acetyltransferase involved in cellulose biosynthesis
MSDRLLVFAWHNVEGTWGYPAPPGAGVRGFEQQLLRLRQAGNVVPLGPALRRLSEGEKLPPRAIALTFDDGYRDNLELGLPVLERLGLPATFFLVPGILSGQVRPWWEVVAWGFAHSNRASVVWEGGSLPVAGSAGRRSAARVTARLKELDEAGRQQAVKELLALLEPGGGPEVRDLFLDWDGARELLRRGFSVGAHSMGHAILARQPAEEQALDLATCRRRLEDELGVTVNLFAYPNGTLADYDRHTVQAAQQAGYAHALTARAGWNTSSTPPFELRRVVLEPHRGLSEIVAGRALGRLVRMQRAGARAVVASIGRSPGVGRSTGPATKAVDRAAARQRAPVRLEAAGLESLEQEWKQLAKRTGNVFASWEWASLWWRHFGSGRRPLVVACRSADDRLVGILPLYLWVSRPLRILRFIGHGAGDQLGPVHAPGDREVVADALREALARIRWGIFVGEQLPADEGWSDRLRGRALVREGSPVLRAPAGGWDGFLAGRSANFRQQLGRRERNLARRHRVRFHLVQDGNELPAAMDKLFALHGLRWQQGSSAFQPRADFHREFAAVALERGWLRLWLLQLDEHTVAAWYGFRFGQVESYYQAGRDPAWDHLSVGFVLLAHSIREAFRDGAVEYRFGRGHEPYKYRFADWDPGLETIALTRGAVPRAALSAAHHAYPLVKHRLGKLRWQLT